MGVPAPTSVYVRATAPPPPRLGSRGERPAVRLRQTGVLKMNYPD